MENEMKGLPDKKEVILSEVETFAKAEYDVARLRMIDKISRVLGSFLLSICLILIAFAVLSFCAAAAVFALAQCMPTWAACLLVGAVYLLLIPVMFACSKAMFINPIVNKLSGLKDLEDLKCETVRAEGRAALHRERMNERIRFVRTIWNIIRRLFKK